MAFKIIISSCLHTICVYCVYLLYVYINTHTYMYTLRKNMLDLYLDQDSLVEEILYLSGTFLVK